MATLLSNPAKSLILQPPKSNSKLSEIAASFDEDHSIINHRSVSERLLELNEKGEKCHVYLQYGWTTAWYQRFHRLVIPGLESRELVFPMSPEDPFAKSVSIGFSNFFGYDADIKVAKGRWYLCNFEVKQTLNGYELIMPVPDSIELLCQKCLGVTISEPVKDGMEALYICQDCFSPEEE